MKSEINELYESGIKYWNRNYLNHAKNFFDKILIEFDKLESYKQVKIIEFYEYIKEIDICINLLEKMIYKEEEIHFSIPKYIELKNYNIECNVLNKISNYSVLKNNINYRIKIADIYKYKGNLLRAYEIYSNLIDYIEENNIYKKDNIEIYIDTLFELIKLEYQYKEYVQARLQLRKIIVENNNYKVEEVFRWALLLDSIDEVLEIESWVGRINFIEQDDIKVLIHTYIKIYTGQLKESTYNLLNAFKFKDNLLKEKAYILKIYIKKCRNDLSWKNDIENVDLEKNYQALLMYYEKYKNTINAKHIIDNNFKYHSDRKQVINVLNMINRKDNNKFYNKDLQIKFIGGSDSIGESCILIKYKSKKIILDIGKHVSKDEDSIRKDENLKDLIDADYVFISHAHFDHIGNLPYLNKINPNANVYSTLESKDIMKVMLEDSIKINKGLEDININDIKNLVSKIKLLKFNQTVKISDDIKVTFYRAGHILGAAYIYLELGNTTVLYTGDYCVHDQYTVKGFDFVDNLDVDILISESTYVHYPSNFNLSKINQEYLLVDTINSVTENNGIVLIPAFALGRAQEILLTLQKYYKSRNKILFPIYIDGKVTDICDIYNKHLKKEILFEGVNKVNPKYRENRALFESKFKGSCIIASSGMLNTNSVSAKYANEIVSKNNSCILFSGYLDEESPGKQLLSKLNKETNPIININGEMKSIHCNVKSFKLSAHAKKYEVLQTILRINPRYLFLIHGDTNNEYKYKNTLGNEYDIYPSIKKLLEYCNNIKVITPTNGEFIDITNEERN